MGLMQKIFGAGGASAPAPHSRPSQFANNEAEPDKSRNGPRRELVHVVLRDTMSKHGVPSDWIDIRILSVLTRKHKSGMHVQFLVRKADDQLVSYIHAFQESFWEQLLRFEPHARDWLFSVGWEFGGKAKQGFTPMPDPTSWDDAGDTQPGEAGDTRPPEDDDPDALATDLQALHAAMSGPADLADLPKPRPQQQETPGKF